MSDESPELVSPKAVRKPRKKATPKPEEPPVPQRGSLWKRMRRAALRALAGIAAFYLLLILLFSFVPPFYNVYQLQERMRLGAIDKSWVPMEEIAPVMGRAAVAAEDANFCQHWGFDMAAIRANIDSGRRGGASTISQQVVKNVFLWQGRSWLRKSLEAMLTPVVELVWSKERILEVYLNVAEFDEGVFGVQAAAQHYFNVDARKLSALQAARLAAILPAPKDRSASDPSNAVRKRTRAILSGADTIKADGRAKCFQ